MSQRTRGTVLMECTLVLPILVSVIFAIVQFALIWYAHLMTHYAAYPDFPRSKRKPAFCAGFRTLS